MVRNGTFPAESTKQQGQRWGRIYALLDVGVNLKQLLAILLSFVVPMVVFAETGYKVEYDGGSIPDVKSGADLKMAMDSENIRFTRNKTEVAVIPVKAVTEVSYGQDVHRRVGAAIGIGVVTLGIGALMALTKSKKHFIGITWDDAGRKGGLAFQADKNDYRGLLAGLEGLTGKKAVNSDTMTVKN
jgi:hypothetical protein